MLTNLNKLTFAPFGTVVNGGITVASERLGYSIIKTREITYSSFTKLYYHPTEKTALDISSGNAILFIGKSKDELTAFLLDAAVIINPEIYFYTVPLVGNASISIAESPGMKFLSITAKEKPQTIIPYIEPKEIYTLFYHEKEPGFTFKGESHDFWELTYVDKGTLINQTDEKKYTLSPGNVMLFAPNQFHRQYAEEGVSTCYITISFKMNDINRDLLCDTVFAPDGEVKSLMSKIMAESESGRIFSEDLMLTYLKEIIICLARSKRVEKVAEKSFAPVRQNIEENIVASAMRYIGQNLSLPLNISNVAKSIPVSSGYLTTLFKKNTGMTPGNYITAKKMELAKTYIREERYTFTQIAMMTGYNNIHYFSASFKKQFGITPTEYANAIKKD